MNVYLRTILPQVPNPGKEEPIGHLSRTIELVRRLAYDHVREGEAPEAAAHMALEQVLGRPVEAARIDRRSEANELLTDEAVVSDPSQSPGDSGQSPVAETVLDNPAGSAAGSQSEVADPQRGVGVEGGVGQENTGKANVDSPPAVEDEDADRHGGDPAPVENDVNPGSSALAQHYEEFSRLSREEQENWQPILLSRIAGDPQRRRRQGMEDVAWVVRSLAAANGEQKDFAVAYAAYLGNTGEVDLRDMLSAPALDAYLEYSQESFERAHPIDMPFGLGIHDRTVEAANLMLSDWSVPQDIAVGVLEAIQGSINATEAGLDDLKVYIDRVVGPFNRDLRDNLKAAAEAIHSNRNSVENIPARYAFFLSHEALLELGNARQLLRADFEQELYLPADLLENLGIGTTAGAAVSMAEAANVLKIGVMATALGAALTVAGLVASGLSVFEAIDDTNQAHADYLIRLEIQRRLHDSRLKAEILALMSGHKVLVDPRNLTIVPIAD